MRKLRILSSAFIGASALLIGSFNIEAHTIEYGFSNAGPGAVTFWFGSYHQFSEANADGNPNEGFLQIQGINGNPFPLTAIDFTIAKAEAAGAPPAADYVQGHHINMGLETTLWQGVTFTSVIPGDYSFFFNQNASVNGTPAVSVVFAAWDTSVTSGTFTLTGEVTGSVPEGGSTFVLLGLGLTLVGFGKKLRRS